MTETNLNNRIGTFPLSAPTKGENGVTVELMLKEPTRITRYITEKVADNLLSPRLYSSTSVSGGALIYNQLLGLESAPIAAERTSIIEPGGEFPEVGTWGVSEDVKRVRKIGGKASITDEAVKRNDDRLFRGVLDRLANRMVIDLDSDAIAEFRAVEAALADNMQSVKSVGWNTAASTTAAEKVPATSIEADLEAVRLIGESNRMGYNYSVLLMHPKDASKLRLALGIANYAAFVGQWGLTIEESYAMNEGEAYALAPGQVGVIGVESPISTESWREHRIQTNYTQTWATMAYAVTDPMAIIKLEGISA